MVEVKGLKFTVILREEPEGGYSAQCIELPGAISQGENREQAITNIREAIEGYLEAFLEEDNKLVKDLKAALREVEEGKTHTTRGQSDVSHTTVVRQNIEKMIEFYRHYT